MNVKTIAQRKNILMAGIFVGLLTVMVMVFVFVLGVESSLFRPKITLSTLVQNAQNLKVGAAVQLRGIKIGVVKTIEFEKADLIKVAFQLDASYKAWIHKDCYISFRTQGVLGDRFIEILGGNEDSPLIEDGESLATKSGVEMDKVLSKGEDILEISGQLLHRIDTYFANVNPTHLGNIMTNLNTSAQLSAKFFSTLKPEKVNSMIQNLDRASSLLAAVTERVNSGPGSMHSLIYDPSVHDDLQSLLGGAKRNKLMKYFIQKSIEKSDPQPAPN
ncbi:MAG: MlaD family protein [Pseudomonadota bacterium]